VRWGLVPQRGRAIGRGQRSYHSGNGNPRVEEGAIKQRDELFDHVDDDGIRFRAGGDVGTDVQIVDENRILKLSKLIVYRR